MLRNVTKGGGGRVNLSTLKKMRCEKNLTHADMGKKIGITRTAYTNKESGLRRFSPEEMYAIANLFGKSIEDIFFKIECYEK